MRDEFQEAFAAGLVAAGLSVLPNSLATCFMKGALQVSMDSHCGFSPCLEPTTGTVYGFECADYRTALSDG